MSLFIKPYETRPMMQHCIIGGIDELRPPIVITVPDRATEYYYVHLNNMGSIQLISDSNANLVNEWQYSAWGARTRIYGDSDLTDRGYTLHEHILSPFGGAGGGFGLINMNGRIYDPVLARFLSPDPYVQMPDFTQSYNRYSYCLNNPFSYTDPSGEFVVIDSWIIGFFRGLFKGGFKEVWNTANKSAWNDMKIWGGLFATDPNKNFWQRTGEFFSRFTWQLPQTIAGFMAAHSFNTFGIKGGVESVNYKYGATVLQTKKGGWGAVTLSSYIIGSNSIRADENHWLFQHEYGHYLQSQSMGWAYLARVGIPSLVSAGKKDGNHDFQPFEQDANRRAFEYFNKNIDGFYKSQENFYNGRAGGWKFYENPLDVNHIGEDSRGDYYDYHNSTDMKLVNSLALQPKWYDYFDPFGILFAGWINASYYNKHRIR